MTEGLFGREPIDCARLRGSPLLRVYLDGELPVTETLAVQFHLERCSGCRRALVEERAFRRRLRQEFPPAPVSTDVRERVRRGIVRWEWMQRLVRSFRWVAAGTLGSVAVVLLLLWGFRIGASEPDLVKDLVSSHRLYSRLEARAELASDSQVEVAAWVRRQLAFAVPVPDFRQAGLKLIGARLAAHGEHPMAHLFYEKGRTLLSLYVLPASGVTLPRQGWTVLDGEKVLIRKSEGHQVLLGRSGRFVFALVSGLGRDDLIECARTFLREGGQRQAGTPAALTIYSREVPVS